MNLVRVQWKELDDEAGPPQGIDAVEVEHRLLCAQGGHDLGDVGHIAPLNVEEEQLEIEREREVG